MKKIKRLLFIIMITMAHLPVIAQPLPPATPDGNPVPVGENIAPLIMVVIIAGINTLKRKNNNRGQCL